jgi:patatin-like phospholipase/acyl hydrolase
MNLFYNCGKQIIPPHDNYTSTYEVTNYSRLINNLVKLQKETDPVAKYLIDCLIDIFINLLEYNNSHGLNLQQYEEFNIHKQFISSYYNSKIEAYQKKLNNLSNPTMVFDEVYQRSNRQRNPQANPKLEEQKDDIKQNIELIRNKLVDYEQKYLQEPTPGNTTHYELVDKKYIKYEEKYLKYKQKYLQLKQIN